MIKGVKKIGLMALLILLCSCSINPKLPVDRHLTSENVGAGRNKINLGVAPSTKLSLTGDYTTLVIDKSPAIKSSLTPGLSYSKGINNWVDFETTVGMNTPLYLGGNIQLLGNPYANSGQNNFSFSIRFWTSIYVTGKSYTTYQGTTRSTIYSGYVNGAGPSIGFRPLGPLLIYAYYTKEKFKFVSDISGDIKEEIHGDGEQSNLGIGCDFKLGELSMNASVNKTEASLKRDASLSNDGLRFGGSIGYLF